MASNKKIAITVEAKTAGAVAGVDRLTEAVDKMTAATRKAEAASKAARSAMKKTGVSVDQVAHGALILGGGMYAATRAVDTLITGTFRYEQLMRNLPFAITEATKATGGFIQKTKLMDAAIFANRSGVTTNAKAFSEFARNAQLVAKSTGQDASEAVEVLTRAFARQQPKLLDNYNIILTLTEAKRIYRKQIEDTGRAYTEEDDARAFAEVGLQKLAEVAKGSKLEMNEYTEAWLKWKAVLTDVPRMAKAITDEIGELSDGMYELLKAIDEFPLLNFKGAERNDVRGDVHFNDPKAEAARKLKLYKQQQQHTQDLIGQAQVTAAVTASNKANAVLDGIVRAEEEQLERGMKIQTEHMNKMLEGNIRKVFLGIKDEGSGGAKGLTAQERAWAQQYGAELTKLRMDAMIEGAKNAELAIDFDSQLQAANGPGQAANDTLLRFDPRELDGKLEALRMEADATRELTEAKAGLRELDPLLNSEEIITSIYAERDAKLDLLDAEQRYVETYLQGEALIAERARINQDRVKASHVADVKATQQQTTEKKKHLKIAAQVGNQLVDVSMGVAAAAAHAAVAGEKFGAKQVKGMAAQAAVEMGLQAVLEGIRAAISAAMYDFPGAAAHTANAVSAGAGAALAGGIAGVAAGVLGAGGGAGGGGGGGGSSGGRQYAPMAPFNRESAQSNNGAPPVSRRGEWAPAPPPGQSATTQGAVIVNVGEGAFQSLAPAKGDDFVFEVKKALAGERRRIN